MAQESIGAEIAELRGAFNGLKDQILVDNAYMKGKLDTIVAALATKVGMEAYERDTGKFNRRLHDIEIKSPAIIQQIVLVLSTGTVAALVSAVVSYLMGKLP